LLLGLQLVHEATRQGVLRQVSLHRPHAFGRVVGVGLKRSRLHAARLGDVLLPRVPQRADPDACLLAVLRRHVRASEGVRRRLVGADLEHVHVHAELVGGALEVLAEVAVALDQHRPVRIQEDLVGLRRQVVLPLVEPGSPREDLLAGLAEPPDGLTEVLQRGQPGPLHRAQVQHQRTDAVVAGGAVDHLQQVPQPGLRAPLAEGLLQRPVERVTGELLDDLPLRRNHQGGLGGDERQ